jgi:hypothetical protein
MADLSDGVDVADVRDIYNTGASDEAVSVAIDAAAQVLDRNLTKSDYDDADYNRIQLYLSVHYLTIDPQLTEYSMGDASHPFELNSGTGIEETRYGRVANELSDGELARVGAQTIDFEVIDV